MGRHLTGRLKHLKTKNEKYINAYFMGSLQGFEISLAPAPGDDDGCGANIYKRLKGNLKANLWDDI